MIFQSLGLDKASLYAPMYELCVELGKRGQEIHVITERNEILEKAKDQNVIYHFVPKVKPTLIHRMIQILKFFKEVLHVFSHHKIDVVYTHNQLNTPIPAYIPSKIFNVPLVYWRCIDSSTYSSLGQFLRKRKILGLLLLFLHKTCNLIVTCTKNEKQSITNLFRINPLKIKIYPNFVNLERFKPSENEKIKKIREKLKLSGRRIILYVHRLASPSGPAYLIHAAKIVIDKAPNTAFVFIGDGPQKESLQNLVKHLSLEDSVIITGWIPNYKLPLFYELADIFVLPSIREGFGRVNIEAMAMKTPVIATKVGGVPEVLGKSGILVPPKDSESIANAILFLLNNEEKRKYYAEKGYERVRKLFTLNKATQELLSIFQEIR